MSAPGTSGFQSDGGEIQRRTSVGRHIRTAALTIIWGLTVVLTIAGAAEAMPQAPSIIDLVEAAVIFVLMAGMASLGVLIVVRARNRVGWVLCLGTLVFAAQYWAFFAVTGPIAQWLFNSVGYTAGILVIPTLILLFPDGRLPSRRWRPVAWLGIGGATAGMLSILFAPTVWDTNEPTPFAGFLPDAMLTILDTATSVLLIPFLVGVVASLIVRYRNAGTLQRLQLKMFGYGAALALAGSLTSNVIGIGADAVIAGAIVLMALPLSITAAIMRYRLFDIERLISRTIGYAIVVATLALVYAAGAVWLPSQIIGEQSTLFVAGSTLAAASLFSPVRRRVIDRVDRRFNRSRYDSQRVIAEFNERLTDEIDVDQITADSTAVITRTVQPESLSVWIRG